MKSAITEKEKRAFQIWPLVRITTGGRDFFQLGDTSSEGLDCG
jgi:hypothetical protein